MSKRLRWKTSTSPTPKHGRSTAVGAGSGRLSRVCRPQNYGPGCWRWPMKPRSVLSRSILPTPRNGARSTGRSHWPPPTHKPPVTTPRAWRSAGAPSGIGSGDGRHRPDHTRAMWPGIGPPRPDPPPEDVRKPAAPRPNHGHDPCTQQHNRTRATRRPNTVRGRPPSRTHFRSVFRNGWSREPPPASRVC